MADLTIAVSEAVCAKTLEVVVANFEAADRASFGSFMAGFDGRLVLKGGSLDLRDDGTVRLRELDARWTSSSSRWGWRSPSRRSAAAWSTCPPGPSTCPV